MDDGPRRRRWAVIAAVVRVGWLALRRDPVALALTVVLPLVFFSVFAGVFRGTADGSDRPIAAVVLDRDGSPRAARLAARLATDPGLAVVAADGRDDDPVAAGRVPVAIVIREGFDASFPPGPGAPAPVAVRVDTSHPVAGRVASAAIQRALVGVGLESIPGGWPSTAGWIETVDVLGGDGRDPAVSYFAAGLGVMFLLFAVSGRAAILIEERESGVLDRVLTSALGVGRLLVGRWLFLTALGAAQVTLMFAWGAIAFGLDPGGPERWVGFTVLTLASAAAAAAFGLVLASACRTRAQLNGVAAVTILILSAVGGSLFPRFLMPEAMQAVGRATFNAWALDGYRELFWYGSGLAGIVPHVGVQVAACAGFLAVARALVVRRERD